MVTFDVKIQWGQIGIRYQWPRTDMHVRLPQSDLEKRQPELKLQVTLPKIVDIDMRAALFEIGLKNYEDSMREDVAETRAHVGDAIAQFSQQGDTIARIDDKSITYGAVYGQVPGEETEVNIDAVPKTRPKATFRPGTIAGDVVYGQAKPRLTPGDTGYTFQYGYARTYLEREPKITITTKGYAFDRTI